MVGDVGILYQKDLYQNISMKLNLITLSAIIFLFATHLKAQTTDFKPSHLKAAEQYLIAKGISTEFGNVVSKMADASSAQIPEEKRASYLKVMNTFMAKYFTWDALKDRLEKMYASEFTEDELKQLTAFYDTPLGKKASVKTPILIQKGMLLGQQAVEDHRPELEQMLKDAFQADAAPTQKNN